MKQPSPILSVFQTSPIKGKRCIIRRMLPQDAKAWLTKRRRAVTVDAQLNFTTGRPQQGLFRLWLNVTGLCDYRL